MEQKNLTVTIEKLPTGMLKITKVDGIVQEFANIETVYDEIKYEFEPK